MPPGPHVIGPCHCHTISQRLGEIANWNRRPLSTPECIARGDILEVIFFRFLHIKARNFLDVFYPFTSMYELYEP